MKIKFVFDFLHRLPDQPSLPGFRPLQESDIPDALRLLKTYLSKID